MTTISTYEVTSSPPIGTSIIPAGGNPLRWRMVSQRNCKPKISRIRSSKRFGFQQGSEARSPDHITSLLLRRSGLSLKEACKPRRSQGSIREIRHGRGAGWQASPFGAIDMLVNSSLTANVQANMVLTAVGVALGSLLLAIVVLLGLS